MDLKTAFAYIVTGVFLMGYSVRAGVGVLLQFQWASMSTDFVIFVGVWLVGLGYFIAGAWHFVRNGLRQLGVWLKSWNLE
jgi:hypothetical protein